MTERGLRFSQGFASESKATVISIVPFAIDEFKPGLIPGQFHIDACEGEGPVCQVIGDSIFYVYIDADRGQLRVPAPSGQVAESLCFDYLSAQLEAKEDCHPGLFWKAGVWTPERVKKDLGDELHYFHQVQNTWFMELVKRADDDWEKTRAHYAISDTQRYALRKIDPENKSNRPWIITPQKEEVLVQAEATTICPACGSDVSLSAVICRYCTCILDEDKYARMSFAKRPGNTVAGVDVAALMKQ